MAQLQESAEIQEDQTSEYVVNPTVKEVVEKPVQPSIEGVLTFRDSIFGDGTVINLRVKLTKAESKSSVDENGVGRSMLRLSGAVASVDTRPEHNRIYKAYTGSIGAYPKDAKYTKVEKK